jgi:hypothetical protein
MKVLAFLALAASLAGAQNIEHQVVASQFGNWAVPISGQVALVAGANVAIPFQPCVESAGGRNFQAVSNGVPLRIVDPTNPSIDEVVTPSGVVLAPGNCTATITTVNAHPIPYFLTSGTAGLQEAINANAQSGAFNTAILDRSFYAFGGSSAIIASVTGSANLPLIDVTFAPYVSYRWNGTAYVTNSTNAGGAAPTAAAGAAAGTSPTIANTGNGNSFTVALKTGTATATGTLFTEEWPATESFSSTPNVTVRSVGPNTPPAFTFAVTGSTTHTLTVSVTTAPAASTSYSFQVSAQ